ncbi:MAG: glutathione S-transferase [Haliea sp.]|uniref:glutathione S-transferase family protein n=1 Tax=Haliea sp. TaxID=1932666 RepID=UPI0032EBDD6B
MDYILHHFDISPFAEKVRLAFGLKGLAWHSVEIPVVMPKPDLTALTGGYRKTPVLQIGADIYCDTQRIASELERRHPARPLFPQGSKGLCLALASWSDAAFFRPGAGLSMGTNTDLPEAILKDRSAFFSFLDFASLPGDLPHLYAQFSAQLQLLETMLTDGRDYLLGAEPSWADILGYFPVWMCRGNIRNGDNLLSGFPHIGAWEQRVAALGHGDRRELDAGAALAIAREQRSTAEILVMEEAMPGLAAGMEVAVTPEDYGAVPVAGELVRLTHEDIAVRRTDPRAGEVVVHFPRSGYRVEKTA